MRSRGKSDEMMLQSLFTKRRSINIHNITNTLHPEYPFLNITGLQTFQSLQTRPPLSSCTTQIPCHMLPRCYSMSRPAYSISLVAFFIQLACTVLFLFTFSDSHFIAKFGGQTAYHVHVLDFKISAGEWESGRSFDSPRLV